MDWSAIHLVAAWLHEKVPDPVTKGIAMHWFRISAGWLLALVMATHASAQDVTFARTDHDSFSGARAIVAADFDRNGWPDLAQANTGRNTVTILLNDGAGRLTLAFDIFKAFEKAANIEQQAGEFRTNGVKRVMHPLSRGNHCLGEHRRLFVPAAAAAGR